MRGTAYLSTRSLRNYRLPRSEKATAQLKAGVLEVTMPKSTQAQAKQIPIKAS